MQSFKAIPNIGVDGGEFTSGFLGLDWLPSASSSKLKSDHESGVLAILNRLLGKRTGWAVLTEIFYTKSEKMVIRPYHPTKTDPYNAFARAEDAKAATMKGTALAGALGYGTATSNSNVVTAVATSDFYQGYRIKIQGTRAGQPYSMSFKYRVNNPKQITLLAFSTSFGDQTSGVMWDGTTGPVTWIIEGSPDRPADTGTGTGSDTEIRFSPNTFAAPGAPKGPGTAPDEILLHEMVHGLRQMAGRAIFEQVNGNPGMENYEEFAAIVISNVYRSELGISPLRQDHWGFNPLTGPTTAAATFKTTYSQYLSDMGVEQPRLCENLRKVSCAFNPFV